MFNKLHICPICYLDYDVKTQMRKKHLIEKNPNYIKQIKGSLNKLNVERADPNVNKYIVRQIKERERKRLIEEAKRLKREKWINGVKIGTRLGALGFIGATGVGVAKHIMLNKRKHVLDSNRIKYIDYQNDFEDMQDQASFMLQNELREEDGGFYGHDFPDPSIYFPETFNYDEQTIATFLSVFIVNIVF